MLIPTVLDFGTLLFVEQYYILYVNHNIDLMRPGLWVTSNECPLKQRVSDSQPPPCWWASSSRYKD